MLFESPSGSVFPPLVLLLSIAAAGRTIAIESWRASNAHSAPAVEVVRPSTLPPPSIPRDEPLEFPPGPEPVEPDELSSRWLELADWRVWWNYNDDPYLALKGHIHGEAVLTGSDDFFLGQGESRGSGGGGTYRGPGDSRPAQPTTMGGGGGGGGGGPSTPGPAGPATAGTRSVALPPGSPGALESVAVEPDPEPAPLSRNASPDERERYARTRADRILRGCLPRPGERPSAMYFRFWGDNPFELAGLDPQSTFGVNVDTASYALARRYLRDGYLPERAQVRTEEFVNYFRADVPPPLQGTFALETELAPSRFGSDPDDRRGAERWMMRVAIRGREVPREERQPLALTFVIDTSGSMKREDRMGLVQHALRLLVAQLGARDSIALVTFSNDSRVVLPTTSALQREVIESAIQSMRPDGGTNVAAGLQVGYDVARRSLSSNAFSRVVLLSDGVANVGQTDQKRITESVREQRQAGIFLNTVGVGMGNHNDYLLEQLANRGDGVCNYVDDAAEARRALVENFTGAFEPIARDVKVQVEFDSSQVFRYRLLGYENRAIADASFRDDTIDAGELGSGHQVVALYELELLRRTDAPLATVRLRWKPPTGAGRDPLEDAASEFETAVRFDGATSWEGSSEGYKTSVLAAQFAEVLRGSTHARNDSLEDLIVEAARLERRRQDPDFSEFVSLVGRSYELLERVRREPEPLQRCVDSLRRQRYERAQCDAIRVELDPHVLQELEREGRSLEARIRDLVREDVERRYR